jgi:putative DNA methylase
MDAKVAKPKMVPFSLKDAPSLIERVWPAQKISVETEREFDAHGAQTLTSLGSYWKGRKRLVYVRACVLGGLLPSTSEPERDLAIFEKLMAIDDDAFIFRENKLRPADVAKRAISHGLITSRDLIRFFSLRGVATPNNEQLVAGLEAGKIVWNDDAEAKLQLRKLVHKTYSYRELVEMSLRPEELNESAYEGIWATVNDHLGTEASSIPELVEQLGIMRYGHRPKVADTFCGAGSIPYEAARVGCDVYASDLNPIACMLTWGALHLVGNASLRPGLRDAQVKISKAVNERLSSMGVEHDSDGNRAKAYLYCLEIKCPQTGWLVPVLPSLVISRIKKTYAKLVPNPKLKRLDIVVTYASTPEEMESAKIGTYQDKHVTYGVDGETIRTPLTSIRGDLGTLDRQNKNSLRLWEKLDVFPRKEDTFGERLYCIQWITKESLNKGRQETFFATPNADDLAREAKVLSFVQENLEKWQAKGFVPDLLIEPGEKTSEPIRTRGWTHWHHLFSPRQLLIGALLAEEIDSVDDEEIRACLSFERSSAANFSSRLSRWLPGTPGAPGRAAAADQVKDTFYNQAINPVFNFASRSFFMYGLDQSNHKVSPVIGKSAVRTHTAGELKEDADIFISDPPYADAVNYHEISEFFIAWLRKNPPKPFKDWVWDSRRPLAIKGDGENFRKAMVEAYSAMTKHMPMNGLQIVMFTHQDARVWGEMAQIFWASGLQVMAAWYVATETSSETKKGGYVQGTVTLVLQRRQESEAGYKDEIVQEVKAAVADQIDTMVGLNQSMKGHGRVENLFEDADLQMAGYAAALRVLTKFEKIDGTDMTKEALRPRRAGEKNLVGEIIDFAVQVANEHMVPEHMPPQLWEGLSGAERFYFKMMDIETTSLRKLDNYQNFAKAFRVNEYGAFMGSTEPNKARLKTAKEFKKAGFEIPEFGPSTTRAALFAIFELENDIEGDDVLSHLKDILPNYHNKRDDLAAIADYIARKREGVDETESRAARILHGLIRNERLG